MGLVGGIVSSSICSSASVMPSRKMLCVGAMVVASLVVSGARSMLLTSLEGSLMLLLGLKGIWFCSWKNCWASPDSFSLMIEGVGLLYSFSLVNERGGLLDSFSLVNEEGGLLNSFSLINDSSGLLASFSLMNGGGGEFLGGMGLLYLLGLVGLVGKF